jgi:hypothetical protein
MDAGEQIIYGRRSADRGLSAANRCRSAYTALGGDTRAEDALDCHLPRVVYHQVYQRIRRLWMQVSRSADSDSGRDLWIQVSRYRFPHSGLQPLENAGAPNLKLDECGRTWPNRSPFWQKVPTPEGFQGSQTRAGSKSLEQIKSNQINRYNIKNIILCAGAAGHPGGAAASDRPPARHGRPRHPRPAGYCPSPSGPLGLIQSCHSQTCGGSVEGAFAR